MERMIKRILELLGPVPDPEAYGRYLATLKPAVLEQRLRDLEAERFREPPAIARGGFQVRQYAGRD